MLTEVLYITPPEWSISNISGKLNPFCHVNLVTTILRDNVPILQKTHRAMVSIRPDGNWYWDPVPVVPVTNEPFPVTDDHLVQLRVAIAAAVERFGVIDHELPDGSIVSYEKSGNIFQRIVKPKA